MKSYNFLILSLFIFICSFISCDSKIKHGNYHSTATIGIPDTCIIYNKRLGIHAKQIRPACAIKYINQYKAEVDLIKADTIPQTVDSLFSYGSQISLSELKTIVSIS